MKNESPQIMKRAKINNLIVVSDLHCGCQTGLCPPEGMQLDDGGRYTPSDNQKIVWAMWEEFWDEWVPMVTRGEPYAIDVNGDAINGNPHGSVLNISNNMRDQGDLAYRVLKPRVDACAGGYYHQRGTEAHVGKSGQEEERLAERLGAIPDEANRFARWELWLRVGFARCHITHHIGTTGSMAYETTAIHKELEQAFVEAGRWGEEPPDVICRSHRHRNAETRIQTKRGFATSFTTAGWQLKTPFVFKIAGGRQTQPQIGGSLIRCGDEDVYTRHKLWNIQRPKMEELGAAGGE